MSKRKDNKGRILKKGESQRKDGVYMYRWTDVNSERKTIYASDLNELRQQENEILIEISNGITRSDIKLNNQIELYLSTKPNMSKATISNYNYYYEHIIKDSFLGKMSIKDIKKIHILKFYKNCKDKDLSNSSIAILQKIIRPALQLAVDSDMIMKNPANSCLKDYPIKKEVKYAMSYDEENEFLERFVMCEQAKFYKPLVCLILYTGMRISEALGLTWDDIDLQDKTININHQYINRNINRKLTEYIETNTKTSAGTRIIPLNDMAYQAILDQKKAWMSCKKVPNYSLDGYSNFVFLSCNTGKIVRHAVVRRLFRKVVSEYNTTRSLELPPISPHILRHTYCTRLAEAGTDIKTMQYLMGHSDIKTTMEVYNHVNKNRVKNEVDKINNLHKTYISDAQITTPNTTPITPITTPIDSKDIGRYRII